MSTKVIEIGSDTYHIIFVQTSDNYEHYNVIKNEKLKWSGVFYEENDSFMTTSPFAEVLETGEKITETWDMLPTMIIIDGIKEMRR